jgi:protocatechuate 3,4-dioxygenase beta subunit
VVLRAATPEADAEVETVLRGELETVDLQLRAVPALAGTVVDAAGAPVPDAEVTASWRGEDGGGGRERLVAGPAGDFRLRDPRPGDYHLEAVAGGAAGAALRGDLEVTVGARPPHDLVVELAPAAEVRGRIVGTALEDVRRLHVVASAAGAGTERGAWADGEGAFSIPGLRPGDWTLTVHAGSGPRLRREVGIGEPGEVVEVELDLGAGDATSRVAGRVTVGGRPLAAGGVRLEPDGGGTVRHATTRYDGSFRVAGLEAGRYRVAVTGDFAAPAAVRVFDLEGEESLYLDLTAAAVEGRVVSAEGLPVAGARVSLGPPGSRSRLFVVETDAAGAFRVPAALAGEYELRAMAPSGAAAGRPLTVGALDAGGLELVVE